VRFEFEFGTVLFYFPFILFRLENRICLSRGVQVAGAVWRTVMMTMAEVGDLVRRTENGRIVQVLSGRMVERSGGAIYGLHRARVDEEREFLG
jgi:hypothetical protein